MHRKKLIFSRFQYKFIYVDLFIFQTVGTYLLKVVFKFCKIKFGKIIKMHWNDFWSHINSFCLNSSIKSNEPAIPLSHTLFHIKSSCIKNSRIFYFSENKLNSCVRLRKSRNARFNICFIFSPKMFIYFLSTRTINNHFFVPLQTSRANRRSWATTIPDRRSQSADRKWKRTDISQTTCRSVILTNSSRHHRKSQFPSL